MRKLGQHNVDRAFDEGLANATMPVSGKVWSSISSELEKDKLRRAVGWYRFIAVASVLLLVGFGAWTLTWQNGPAGDLFAGGKALKPYEIGALNQTCPVDVQEQLANDGRQVGMPQARVASFANVVRQASKTPQPVNSLTLAELRLKEMAARHPFMKPSVDNATEKIAHLRELIVPRNPSLLPSIASHDVRPVPTFSIPEDGLFASLLPPKAAQKRQEKEYTFALEEESRPERPDKRWELGAGFASDMTFASTTPLEQNARSSQIIADDPLAANTKRLSPVMAYVSGVRASYEFNDRWSVRSGLSYMNRQSSTTESVNNFGKIDSYQSTLNLSTLEIPVTVRYNVIATKHLEYYVASGVSGNFLLHYNNSQVTSAGKVAASRSSSTNEIMTPSQANLLVSTGLKYRLVDRLNLQLEPGIRYGVATNEYAFSQSRPLSLNLMTGLNYQF